MAAMHIGEQEQGKNMNGKEHHWMTLDLSNGDAPHQWTKAAMDNNITGQQLAWQTAALPSNVLKQQWTTTPQQIIDKVNNMIPVQ